MSSEAVQDLRLCAQVLQRLRSLGRTERLRGSSRREERPRESRAGERYAFCFRGGVESELSPDDLVARWLQAHARFRTILSMAVALGRGDRPEAEVIEMSRRCERYLRDILPLEIADEETHLFPRLLGKRPDIDEALEVSRDHRRSQAPLIRALRAGLEGVRSHPTSASHRQRLLVLAERLAFDLGKHLAYEERVIYPALGSLLSEDEQQLVLAEMGAGRELD